MYNEELKTRFVQYYTQSLKTAELCKRTFNFFEEYEIAWGADLCTRTTEELRPVIAQGSGFRSRSKYATLTILKDYVKWCMNTGIEGACDGMLHITDVGIEKLKRQTVANPLHLQRYMDIIFAPEAEQTTDNIYRCFYWLAYGGVAEEDIIKIKCSDVDLSNMVVHYNGTDIPIYREALQAFKNSINLTHFVYINSYYVTAKQTLLERVPGDTIMRGIRSAPSIRTIRTYLSHCSTKSIDEGRTDLKLSYYRVWLSGAFHRMYEREKAGFDVDFSDVVTQVVGNKEYKLDSGKNTQEAKRRQLAREFKTDYERWKAAYNI